MTNKILIIDIIFFSFTALAFFCLGFAVSELYSNDWDFKVLEGIWRKNSTEEWVCVNIKGMSFERAIEVCRHEVGHKIFAEFCEQSEDNWDKCVNITK